MWFVDWLSGSLQVKGADRVNGGLVVWIRENGQIENSTARRLTVQGSYDSTIQVIGRGDELIFSGNPTKFFQGHNLYGPNRLDLLVPRFAERMTAALGISSTRADRRAWMSGNVKLTRVDLTRMYRPPAFASAGWVAHWLAVASGIAHGGRQRTSNRGAYDANTFYVGANSRRITTKLYDKSAELRRRPISPIVLDAVGFDLLGYAANCLRVEVELKSMELKDRKLRMVRDWSPEIGDRILDERIEKLELNDTIRMSDGQLEALPRSLRSAYGLWLSGVDLRETVSRATFYRYRRGLKDYGVDILNVRPRVMHEDPLTPLGRPLRDYLSGSVLEVPEGDAMRELVA